MPLIPLAFLRCDGCSLRMDSIATAGARFALVSSFGAACGAGPDTAPQPVQVEEQPEAERRREVEDQEAHRGDREYWEYNEGRCYFRC